MRVSRTVLTDDRRLGEQAEIAVATAAAVADDVDEHLDEVRRLWVAGAGVAAAGVLLGGLVAVAGPTGPGVALLALGVLAGGGLVWRATDREPDVTVTGVEKRYWTAHLFPRGNGTLVYDATDTVPHSTFTLERLRDPETLREARSDLAGVDDLPVVMDRDANVEGRFRTTLERVSAELGNAETREVSAPLVDDDTALAEGLRRLEGHVEAGPADGGTVEIPLSAAREDIELVEQLEELAFDDDAEAELEGLKRDSGASVERLAEARSGAVEVLNDHIGTAGDVLALSTYNFYCPDCAAEDVESRLEVRLEGGRTAWFCETCQRRFEDEIVLPKHRIKDELVEDVWDQLWIEKDDQRRRVYERIEDDKAELKEREFEQQREEIRQATERIKDVRSKIRDLKTRAKASEGAIDSISSKMVEYDHLSASRRQQFVTDVREERREVRERTEEIIEETSGMREQRIEEAEQEAERRAALRRAEEQRRHREKLAIQSRQLALQGSQAAMQAEQLSTQQEQLAAMEDQHREEMLLETEGEVSAWGTVNWWREKKGQLFGRSKVGVSD